eukprot:scaffold235805_cov20-Tisochrysis_lutea.AAC.1
MRVDTNGNAATMTPADDYADLICSLVRELRYSPLDREYSTQILNSFNMELALATPKQDDGATGGPSNETSGARGARVLGVIKICVLGIWQAALSTRNACNVCNVRTREK